MNIRSFIFLVVLGIITTPNIIQASWSDPIDIMSLPDVRNQPVVGVDPDGNALIMTDNIDGAHHPLILPLSVNGVEGSAYDIGPVAGPLTGETASISVNALGNAAVAWGESVGGVNVMKSATLIDGTLSGISSLTDKNVFDATYIPTPGINLSSSNSVLEISIVHALDNSEDQVQCFSGALYISGPGSLKDIVFAGSPSGKAISAWVINNTALITFSFDGSGSWLSTGAPEKAVFSACTSPIAVAINNSDNAMLIWQYDLEIDGDHYPEIHSMSFSNGVYQRERILYTPPANEDNDSFALALDRNGNAIALWTTLDLGSGVCTLMASRYSNDSWGTPIALDSSDSISCTNIAFDDYGNAYAVWQKRTDTVYYNYYNNTTKKWFATSRLLSTTPGSSATSPSLSMNGVGNATVAWLRDPSNLQAAQTRNPTAAQSLLGSQIINKFIFQSEVVNILTWNASPDPLVTSYNIFRDYSYIGTVQAGKDLYYEDHGRTAGESVTYQLVGVNDEGIQSAPLSVTIA